MHIVIKSKYLMHNPNYRGASLEFPADKAEILDALDVARVPYGSGEYQLFPHEKSPGFVTEMLNSHAYNPSISEMNHLAGRIEQLNEDEFHKLEGIIQIHGSYDIMDVINSTHNLDKFEMYPGVVNEAALGDFAVANEIYPILENVSDELMDCFDYTKLGNLVRKQDGGVITEHGYIMPCVNEWDVVYDGDHLAERAVKLEPNDPIISLHLRRGDMPDMDIPDACLHCPASDADVAAVLNRLEAESLDDCFIQSATSVIPAFNYAFSFDEDIEQINALAGAIKTHCGSELPKYKAAYEMENITDIGTALRLAVRLAEYDFESHHPSTEAFGRAALEKTGMDVKLAAEYGFDFDAYGHQIMQEKNIRLTPYGFINHPRGQALSIQVERGASGLHMPETVQAIQKAYPPGTQVQLIRMEGEANMLRGMTGQVEYVDDAASIHVRWQNGSTLALLPDTDFFQKLDGQAMAMEEQVMEKPIEQTMCGM